MSAHNPVALSGDPKFSSAIICDAGNAGMRFDVALVDRRGVEGTFDYDIGLGKTLFDVTKGKLNLLGDVRRLVRLWCNPFCDHILVEEWGVRLHGVDDIDDVRQDFVLDLDQFEGFSGNGIASGGNGCNRVAFKQDLVARYDVAKNITVVDQHFASRDEFRCLVVEVIACDDRLDARECLGLRDIDFDYLGMSMW